MFVLFPIGCFFCDGCGAPDTIGDVKDKISAQENIRRPMIKIVHMGGDKGVRLEDDQLVNDLGELGDTYNLYMILRFVGGCASGEL